MDLDWKSKWSAALRAKGLVELGAVPLAYGSDWVRFCQWIEEGRHGSMEFLERHRSLRQSPEALLPGASCALVVGLPYDDGDRLKEDGSRVAMYARYRDYHRQLKRVLTPMSQTLFGDGEFRVLVDSAPVLERALAARTGQGFVGKNTCFIHPEAGSLLLLGEVLVRGLEVEGEEPWDSRQREAGQGCGPCRACQTVCPTGALDEDFRLDAKRCLSYWTIEQRGTIPEEFWPHLATYWFGCDLCQLACPYNRPKPREGRPAWFEKRQIPPLEDVAVMTQVQYEQWFGGTPLTRAKREGLQRNALIALAVQGYGKLESVLEWAEKNSVSPVPETVRQIRQHSVIARSEALRQSH